MDARRVATFLILGTTLCVTLYISPSLPDIIDSHFPLDTMNANQIECVEIIHRWGDYFITYYEYHRIALENGVYRTNTGEEIDNELILSLADSLTDLYETDTYEERYEDWYVYDYEPHFVARIKFANKNPVYLKSDSDYYCFIPWNVIQNGKLYVQYNGKIPTALLRILKAIDEGWSCHKELKWGCYSAVVPERYLKEGVSKDFSQSKEILPVEQEVGKKHLLWNVSLGSPAISSPVYATGKVFTISLDCVSALDVRTGRKVWEVPFEDYEKSEPLRYYAAKEKIAVYEGALYVCSPDSWVYSLDCKTGNVLWKYKVNGQPGSLMSLHDKIIVRCGLSIEGCDGMFCLDKKTGEKVWEAEGVASLEVMNGDMILYGKFAGADYWIVLDGNTGEQLWKDGYWEIDHTVLSEGKVYYRVREENVVTCRDVQSSEEIWTFDYNAPMYARPKEESDSSTAPKKRFLSSLEASENGILLSTYVRKSLTSGREFFMDAIMFLDLNGAVIWSYYYPPETVQYDECQATQFRVIQDKVFFTYDKGIMEVFDLKTGKKLWETEVRGTGILDIEISENVYTYANDGRIYCLDMDTGRILWLFETEKDFAEFSDDFEPIFASGISDGLIFVATKYGNVFAFSLDLYTSSNLPVRTHEAF
jgi:outer membrane protein assembly factor BamB